MATSSEVWNALRAPRRSPRARRPGGAARAASAGRPARARRPVRRAAGGSGPCRVRSPCESPRYDGGAPITSPTLGDEGDDVRRLGGHHVDAGASQLGCAIRSPTRRRSTPARPERRARRGPGRRPSRRGARPHAELAEGVGDDLRLGRRPGSYVAPATTAKRSVTPKCSTIRRRSAPASPWPGRGRHRRLRVRRASRRPRRTAGSRTGRRSRSARGSARRRRRPLGGDADQRQPELERGADGRRAGPRRRARRVPSACRAWPSEARMPGAESVSVPSRSKRSVRVRRRQLYTTGPGEHASWAGAGRCRAMLPTWPGW